MAKIVFIGAGSGFGTRLSRDIMSHEPLRDSTLCLVDINERHLGAVEDMARETVRQHNLPTRIEASADRRKVLEGADYVITSISVGGPAYDGVPFYHEIEIPAQYGIFQGVGDTVGPGGVMRTLRTAPVMVEICRDIEELCPDAWLINYVNPMAMLQWAMTAASSVKTVGLCHSVQGTANQLARYIGAPTEEITYWCAGINHMAWYLEYAWNGEDAYPKIRAAADDPEIYAKDSVRFEIMKHFDHFVTESTRHMSEYVPYFRKNREVIEGFNLGVMQPNKVSAERRWEWLEETRKQLKEAEEPQELKPSGEYASYIIRAIETGEPFRFNGNVPNRGIITNLPPECCVEVPCLVDKTGVRPCHVGDLPPQLAALNGSSVALQELTVEAVLERDLHKAEMAMKLDPLSAAVCTLAELDDMVKELYAACEPWLGYYGEGS